MAGKSVDGTLHQNTLITRNVDFCGAFATKPTSLM